MVPWKRNSIIKRLDIGEVISDLTNNYPAGNKRNIDVIKSQIVMS
jgi:hypothetical protein